MRKRGAGDALFPAVRRGLLGVTFREPARWWYLTELANALGTSPSSLQREVDALASTGILEKRVDGRRTLGQIQRDLAENTGELHDWASFVADFQQVFRVFNGINSLFLSRAGRPARLAETDPG